MRFNMSESVVDAVIDSLKKQHQDMMEKGTSWSFDLDGDYDKYTQFRTQELELAGIINMLYRQKNSNKNNPTEVPLADWEKELLSGGREHG